MAPKRKSDAAELDFHTEDNDQAFGSISNKARKSNGSVDATASRKEEPRKPQSWQDVKLDGEDEVSNKMTRS